MSYRRILRLRPHGPLHARSVVGLALLLIALAAAVIWINRPGTLGVRGGPSPTPAVTTAASPSPIPSPSAPPTTAATPLAIGIPEPGDAATAATLAINYQDALIHRQWRTAWDLLSTEQQTHWGSYDQFVYDRSAYIQSANGRYAAKPASHDAAAIRGWVVPGNFPAAPVMPATPDYDRAFLVEIDYPALSAYNAWEMLLAAPDKSGQWFIWQLR